MTRSEYLLLRQLQRRGGRFSVYLEYGNESDSVRSLLERGWIRREEWESQNMTCFFLTEEGSQAYEKQKMMETLAGESS